MAWYYRRKLYEISSKIDALDVAAMPAEKSYSKVGDWGSQTVLEGSGIILTLAGAKKPYHFMF